MTFSGELCHSERAFGRGRIPKAGVWVRAIGWDKSITIMIRPINTQDYSLRSE